MNIKRLFYTAGTLLAFILLSGCALKPVQNQPAQSSGIPGIIPKPAQITLLKGEFVLTADSKIWIETGNKPLRRLADYLAERIQQTSGIHLTVKEIKAGWIKGINNGILLSDQGATQSLGHEGYSLNCLPSKIHIRAVKPAGLFYGIQTLLQLLPISEQSLRPAASQKIPCVMIADMPRYSYRGMHLDVGRHFMPKSFIKKYLDYLAMHKINTFHWHLTEDQGWRIAISRYPKLAKVSAWRKETLSGHYREYPQKYDKTPHGGFYSKEDIKEIVAYAQRRFINVIPEIEMPGHSQAALAAYPEISCTGGPFEVATRWGVMPDVYCAGKEATFTFLENVLTEVMALFPSKYIHIGGDECPKTRWKACKDCQKRIKAEGLKDEHELQSYFIKRIEKFLNAKGRKLIGWDEILEGGLAPDATVMSWRGTQGGIKAARQNHDVIMTPNADCYFDHYQGRADVEPLAIGGYSDLKEVYAYEPTPAELSPAAARHILGAQGNVWTEYMKTPSHVEYMAIPRMAALAEVVWSPKSRRNWVDFTQRMEDQYKRYARAGIHYAKSVFDVFPHSEIDSSSGQLKVAMKTQLADPDIRYTLNGRTPTAKSKSYQAPFPIRKTTTVRAGIFKDGKLRGHILRRTILHHKAVGKPFQIIQPANDNASTRKAARLLDGMQDNRDMVHRSWVYYRKDLEGIIDLGKPLSLNRLSIQFFSNTWWMNLFLPASISVEVAAEKDDFKIAVTHRFTPQAQHNGPWIEKLEKSLKGHKARYIKIHIKPLTGAPSWHPAAGKPVRFCLDEIVVQ